MVDLTNRHGYTNHKNRYAEDINGETNWAIVYDGVLRVKCNAMQWNISVEHIVL